MDTQIYDLPPDVHIYIIYLSLEYFETTTFKTLRNLGFTQQ